MSDDGVSSGIINIEAGGITFVLGTGSLGNVNPIPPTSYPISDVIEAVQFQPATAAQLDLYETQMADGATLVQVAQEVLQEPLTLNIVDAVIREYQAAFDRAPDQGGLSFWVNEVATSGSDALANLSTDFANSAEFSSLYGVTGGAPASTALVEALYQNVLGREGDATGVAYWSSQHLDAAQLLQAFAQSPEFVSDSQAAVSAFEQTEIANTGIRTYTFYDAEGLTVSVSPLADGGLAGPAPTGNGLELTIFEAPPGLTMPGAPPIQATINLGELQPAQFQLTLLHNSGEAASYQGWAAGNATNSLVNVTTATTLNQALDLAAGQVVALDQQFAGGHTTLASVGTSPSMLLNGQTTLADWFRFGGDTYIVEANNNGMTPAAHSAFGATDVAVELVGSFDVTHFAGVLFS